MKERNINNSEQISSLMKLIHNEVLIGLIDCISGISECMNIEKPNSSENRLTTVISTKDGTSTSVSVITTMNRAKTRVHTRINNNIVEEKIHFAVAVKDLQFEFYNVIVDDGLDEDLVSNDGILNTYFDKFILTSELSNMIKKI